MPPWLRQSRRAGARVHALKARLREGRLHTVCEQARCPNLGECFSRGTATIMILGDRCTRRCGFCAVQHGLPEPPDAGEPEMVARQVLEMDLSHAVVTSVTRDDLPDGGAGHFAAAIREIRRSNPKTAVEVLAPDFEGRERDVHTVCRAGPDVFNHNIETVERLTPSVRDRADYRRSLGVLAAARRCLPNGLIKSGLMVGLGEKPEEVELALADLCGAGCHIVTIGQYLPPSRHHLPLAEYVAPERFRSYEEAGRRLGLMHVFAGPLVRSSYLADEVARRVLEGPEPKKDAARRRY